MRSPAVIRRPHGEEGCSTPTIRTSWALAYPAESDYAALGSEPIHIFRVGPLYDRYSGEFTLDITDEILAELARVFPLQRADGQTCPIDWGHGTEISMTPEEAGPLGEVLDLIHKPGEGMWARVAWTARGRKVVEDGVPVLYTSPSIELSPCYSKKTGEKLGECFTRSLAITTRPRQDSLDPVRLSEDHQPAQGSRDGDAKMAINAKKNLADPPAGTPDQTAPAAPVAPAPVDVTQEPKDLDSAKAIIAALMEQIALLRAKCDEMAAAAPEMEGEGKAAPADANLAELNTLTQRLSLAEKALTKVQGELAAERRKADLDLCESKGYWAPARRAYFQALAEKAPELYAQEKARLAKTPEVQLGEVGTSAKGEETDPMTALDAQIQNIVKTEKVSYQAAFARVRARAQQNNGSK